MYNQYRLFVPSQAVGANKVFFDLYNNSDQKIKIHHIHPIVDGSVAVVGTLGINLFLTFTTAVGTGGTAATYSGTALTAMTFSKSNPVLQEVPTTITARLAPTGGATAGGVITWTSVFGEETSASAYLSQLAALVKNDGDVITVPKNYGVRVVQGSVASAGNVGFDIGFSLE